ncbi:MAG: S8 family serine peptidase [Myxococcota bacterium]
MPLGALFGFSALVACTDDAGQAGSQPEMSDVLSDSAAQTAPDRTAARTLTSGNDALEHYYVVLKGGGALAVLSESRPIDSAQGRAAVARSFRAVSEQHDQFRPSLEATGAIVISDIRRVANAFQVVATQKQVRDILSLDGVEMIEVAPRYRPTLSTGLLSVDAPTVWEGAGGTDGFTGQGIRLGIIDSGIDYLHADFGGPGTTEAYQADDPTVVEPGTFPNSRVVGGIDLAGDTFNPSAGASVPRPDDDPLDCNGSGQGRAGGHGTHVAGIAAGNGVLNDRSAFFGPYNASFDSSAFRVAPGVAPEADLFAIKVFGCEGSTTLLVEALEWSSDPDGDGDFDDRLDIVNGSLGSDFALTSETTERAARNLTSAGTLIVAAAGNTGPTFYTVSSPSHISDVLSVGATFARAGVGLEILSPELPVDYVDGAPSSFGPNLANASVEGTVVEATPADGCEAPTNADAVAGNIALVDRGNCPFVEKFFNMEAAGAAAVIVVNNSDSEIFTMGGDGRSNIPGVMISRASGAELREVLGDLRVRLVDSPYDGRDGQDTMAGLSSRGPREGDGLVKPDISAPGQDILSARIGSGNDQSRKSGTSMASPFVAGVATVALQANPGFSPAQLKALLMSTSRTVRSRGERTPYPVTMQGAGRADAAAAVTQGVFLSAEEGGRAISISFGALEASEPTTFSRTATLTNTTAESVTLDLRVEEATALPGVAISVSPTTITVAPGESSAPITLTLNVDPEALGRPDPDPVTPAVYEFRFEDGDQSFPRHWLNEADGWIIADDQEGTTARVAFHAAVRAASKRSAGQAVSCVGESDVALVTIEGSNTHPSPVVSAFELGTEDPISVSIDDKRADIRAIGAASNLTTADSFDEASVYFGVAVEGQWSTVARPSAPAVRIEVDTDLDGRGDFIVVPEYLGGFGNYFDTLTSDVYSLRTCRTLNVEDCEREGDRQFLNAVPSDSFDTVPFNNSVIVLPAFFASLGLTEGNTALRYRAATVGTRFVGEASAWVNYDPANPRIDTTRFAGTPGRPFSTGDEAVAVQLLDMEGPEPPRLLLLHHMNEIGLDADGGETDSPRRFEIVDGLGDARAAGLEAELTAERTALAGEARTVAIGIVNQSPAPLQEVVVTISGTTVADLAAEGATCDGTTCTWTTLPPGQAAEVTGSVTLEEAATVEANVTSATGCGALTSAALEVIPAALEPAEAERLVVGGGCGCRLDAPRSTSPRWSGALLAGLALLIARRRRS